MRNAMENLQHAGDTCSEIKDILIVEDNAALGNILFEVLQEEPRYQCLLASSAESALTLLQTVTPHLFLLDHDLPGISGLELAYRLRESDEYECTPIVLMSADVPPIQKSLARHHLEGLPKPFDLETFLQLLAKLLAAP